MVNENIKALRKKKGLTQEQLAGKLFVTRQTVSKWEKGDSVPNADIVSKMASVLDVSVSDLLDLGIKDIPSEDYSKLLAVLNEELADKNSYRKKIMKIIKTVLILLGIGFAALIAYILFWMFIAATM
ncbi:MAG TPA: helix-turn-helix transcriptional regulator [Mogibacterium sp.]|nr:helix-turn-helix transcriptional regulator [Mogibacterium sp.]